MTLMRPWLSLLCVVGFAGCSDDGGDGTATDPATSAPGTSSTSTADTPPTTGDPPPTTSTTAGTIPGTDTSDTGVVTSTGTTAGETGTDTTMSADDTTTTSGPDTTTTTSTSDTSTSDTSTGGTTGDDTTGGVMPKCTSTMPTMPPGSCEAIGINLQPPYDDDYTCYDLGPLPGVPMEWGGLIIDRDDPNVLLAGGTANQAAGALYAIHIARDPDCHILGYTAEPTTQYGPAEYNDGGLDYDPGGGPLFISRWPVNELGQLTPGNLVTDKIIGLGQFGVVSSPGGVTFVPPGFAGAGQLKIVSWPGGQWYTLALQPDGMGTFNVLSATLDTTIVGGPEAFVYVSDQNPEFPQDGLLVAEWSAGNIAAYTADDKGTPIVNTRKDFIIGLTGAESAYIDPQSGDFLFATFSGQERLVIIRGFVPQPQ